MAVKQTTQMKKIMYMAVAAIAALSSCSSEEFTQSSNGNNGEAKVFIGTTENDGVSSRSTLVNKTANWESTDEVSINGVTYTTTPDADATKATFTKKTSTDTDPTATYKAVYPATMTSGSGVSTTFSLPASYTYDATKSDAKNFNMPMYAQSETTSLGFKNLCGVLAISVPSTAMTSVSTIVVYSDKQMNGEFTATAAGVLTFAEGTPTTVQKKVTLNFPSAVSIESGSKTFYLPVPAESHTLRIEIFAGTTGKYMTTSSPVTIARNNIYNITFDGINTSEAIDLNLSSGLKWATHNVGATNPQDYGNYYAWGETAGYNEAPTEYNSAESAKEDWDGTTTNSSYTGLSAKTNYSWTYYKWGTSYSSLFKYKSSSNATLNKDDDAAYANCGTGWRMPTSAEFLELARGCYIEWTSDYQSTGVKGVIVYKVKNDADKGLLHTSTAWKEISSTATLYGASSKTATTASYSVSDTHIFLPAAGCRNSASLEDAGAGGYYWSSALNPYGTSGAYNLYFRSSSVAPQYADYSRYYGQSVRPVCQ